MGSRSLGICAQFLQRRALGEPKVNMMGGLGLNLVLVDRVTEVRISYVNEWVELTNIGWACNVYASQFRERARRIIKFTRFQVAK